jgi:exosortase/archaeosortase family protein
MKTLYNILVRYAILLAVGIPNLYLFYLIFTPLTIYPVFVILNTISPSILSSNTVFFQDTPIRLIKACIAGSAYYLLTILNLTTPMPVKKRLRSLAFLFVAFLIINIIRITIFSLLAASGFKYFEITHEVTWYLGSTLILVAIWFISIKIFKIKEIPVYTDFKFLYKRIKRKTK